LRFELVTVPFFAGERPHRLPAGLLALLRVHEVERRQRRLGAVADKGRNVHLGSFVADDERHEGQLVPLRRRRRGRAAGDAVVEVDVALLRELAQCAGALHQVHPPDSSTGLTYADIGI
jgi:hypothetical protein